MHLGHQRAGGVDGAQVHGDSLFFYGAGNAMGAENGARALGDFFQFFNKDCPHGLELIKNMGVVHDFVQHINRGTEFRQGGADECYGAIDPCTETPGFGKKNIHDDCPQTVGALTISAFVQQ